MKFILFHVLAPQIQNLDSVLNTNPLEHSYGLNSRPSSYLKHVFNEAFLSHHVLLMYGMIGMSHETIF